MKIAFASTDNKHVNEHFGWCKCFFMYELYEDGYRFIEAIDTSREHTEENEKLVYKIASVLEAKLLYVAQIGPHASQLVQQAGIFTMRSSHENELIEDVLESLLKLKNTQPPLWMQRLLNTYM